MPEKFEWTGLFLGRYTRSYVLCGLVHSHCLFVYPRVKGRMRFFLSLLAMCAVLRAAEQPNILWITAEDMSPNAWRTVVDIVLNGTFYCSREFGRRHIAAGTPGNIVNIGAAYAWTGGPGFAHSAAGKAGVKNMTETLAVEWGPYGIRVNALVPGLFPHDDEVQAIRSVPERRKNDAARSPAMRVGYPHELGWAATFLASPYAAYISGHTLVVDGANWQRRAMLMPEFVPIREQLGKDPFELD